MLEVAEFLMIPNLKAMCINWLDNCSVTVDNCYKLLELSSIYEFELPKCTEFIRGHLPDMLKKMKMLNITYDSVQLSFSLHYKAPRNAHNPKTGAKVITSAKYNPHFKPGKDLKDRVNASKDNVSIQNLDDAI